MADDLVMVNTVLTTLDDEQRALLRAALKTMTKRGIVAPPEGVQRRMYDRFSVRWEDTEIDLPASLLPLVGTLAELLAADAIPVVATTKKGFAALKAASRPARRRASR
jgi:hypothetical protein